MFSHVFKQQSILNHIFIQILFYPESVWSFQMHSITFKQKILDLKKKYTKYFLPIITNYKYQAVEGGHIEVIQFLLDKGAETDIPGNIILWDIQLKYL